MQSTCKQMCLYPNQRLVYFNTSKLVQYLLRFIWDVPVILQGYNETDRRSQAHFLALISGR